jgi:hypothetical protein
VRRGLTDDRDASVLIAEVVTPGLALGHEVTLTPLGGRHHVVRVDVDGEPHRVVKRAPPAALDGEWRALTAFRGRPWAPGPAERPGPDLLVLPWVAATGPRPRAALGRALADLHSLPPLGHALPPPWVTGLHRPSPRRLARASAGLVALTRTVGGDPVLAAALDALAGGWSASAPVHGDVRGANVVGTADGCVLLDWEAFGDGDPAMDVGWAVGERLAAWTGSMRRGRAGGPALGAAAAAAPPDRAGIVALWDAYRGDGGAADPAEVVRWAGARLVQAAAEESQGSLAPAPTVTAHLAAARAAFLRPGAVAADLGMA